MPWQYSQRTRRLTRNGEQVGNRGYSGARPWQNDPRAEHLRDQGPIPRGQYTIGGAVDREDKGPVTMSLTPVGHNARGRTSFLIHGDSIENSGEASTGCIVLGRFERQRIAASGDTVLMVVE